VIGSARVGCASVFLFGSVETLQALVLPPLSKQGLRVGGTGALRYDARHTPAEGEFTDKIETGLGRRVRCQSSRATRRAQKQRQPEVCLFVSLGTLLRSSAVRRRR